MPSSEELTANFYLWEKRGRGWEVWDFPVVLEPPFKPFYFHSLSASVPAPAVDDGRKPTFLSDLADGFKKLLTGPAGSSDTLLLAEATDEVLPEPFEDEAEIKEIRINFPADEKVFSDYAEQLLLNLASGTEPLSFEIEGSKDSIQTRFACREPDLPQVIKQIRAYFPNAVCEVEGNALRDRVGSERSPVVVDFGLSEEFMRPIRMVNNLDPDPLIAIVGALEDVRDGEMGLVQILFQSTENPWAESMIRSVMGNDGGSFFVDSPEMLPLTREKVASPLFSAAVRVVAQSSSEKRSWDIARSLGNALAVLANPHSNELIPLSNDGYPDDIHLEDVVCRRTHRSGMILNSRELMNFVHLPSDSVRSPKFRGAPRKTKAAPTSVEGHSYILGENVHQNREVKVSLSTEQRLRHVHIVGSTGTGKSTLLSNLIVQDIKSGSGCAVFDPHGDLIDRLLELVPEERMDDVILFDPADTEYPIGFNILEVRSEIEKTVLSSDLVALFRRFSTSWGDQMTAVLGNAVSAFVESPEGGTLAELRRFLIEDEYRKAYLRGVKDPEIVYFWEKQFPLLKGHALSSILTRLDIFLRPKIIRHIVGQRRGLDCDQIINGRKIFFVKLAQGLIGEENAHLLGSLLVSKLHQATMARQAREEKEREPFYIYIDEFQHFITPSMSSVLESGRKFGVGLTVSHQQLKQLLDADEKLANSLLTNPVTRICFRLGDFDAQRFEGGFSYFDAADLENLGVGETIVRVERNDHDFNLRTYPATSVDPETASERRERILTLARERYGERITTATETSVPVVERDGALAATIEAKRETSPPRVETKVEPKLEPPSLPREMVARPSVVEEKKGLSQHRYLQTLVKKMAEQRGYRAVIEEPTPDGSGRVDIGLERNKKRIAVEISVTTGDVQELHNIEKCLRAGYDTVIVCATEKKNLEAIRALISEKLAEKGHSKVLLLEPEELFLFLDQQVAEEASQEVRVKGYRVKVRYQAVTESEKQKKRETITQVIARSVRQMKGKE